MSTRTQDAPQRPDSGVDTPARFAEIEALVAAAVQRTAAGDANPQDPFRGLYVSDELALTLAATRRDGDDLDERLAAAGALLELDALDARVLMLCLAPELDPRFGRLLGYLHDDVTRRLASPRLVARLLAGDGGEREVLDRFAWDMPLRAGGALRLLDGDPQTPLAERPAKVRDQLVGFVLGTPLADDALEHTVRRVPTPAADIGRDETVVRIRELLALDGRLPVAIVGPDAAPLLARSIGAPLLLAPVSAILDEETLAQLALQAQLSRAQLCLEVDERLDRDEGERIAMRLAGRGGGALLCAPAPAALTALAEAELLTIEVPMPTFEERLGLWSEHGSPAVVSEIAAKFRLSATQIGYAAEVARLGSPGGAADGESLHRGARQASSRRLGDLAIRVNATDRFEDLVLPERRMQSLKAISAHLRHRDLVLSGWGFERTVGEGQGLKVLFFGESGTGKTMAGRVLARELGLDMYRIDLAGIVSKYIGETEKNLDRVFDAAAGSNAILFFDEADALFGKRSEVSDAHDRYANIEVAYLLQKMEGYAGAVILTTNFRANLDDAFLRRLDFAIEFPFPEAEQRERLWRGVLPASAPVDDEVDVALLAERFRLSGGSIRNCSLAAAFLAAEAGVAIGMEQLLGAISAEYVKLGRLTVGADFTAAGEPERTV